MSDVPEIIKKNIEEIVSWTMVFIQVAVFIGVVALVWKALPGAIDHAIGAVKP